MIGYITIDTHVHFLPYTTSSIDWKVVDMYLNIAKVRNISSICITEHRHANYYEELINGIFINPKLKGTLIGDGVFVSDNGVALISGAEVAIADGGDIGVHASPEVLLQLSNAKGAYTAYELLSYLKTFNTPYWTVAHHVYSQMKMIQDLDRVMGLLDAIELPAKGLDTKDQYIALAEHYDKPVVGSSDAHTWIQVGIGFNKIRLEKAKIDSIEQIRTAVINRNTESEYHLNASELVSISSIYRDFITSHQTTL